MKIVRRNEMGGVDVLIRHSFVVLLADLVNFVNRQTVAGEIFMQK